MYNNEAEKREFSDHGILPNDTAFVVPDGVNMENEEEWDALMQEVSVQLVIFLAHSGFKFTVSCKQSAIWLFLFFSLGLHFHRFLENDDVF